MADQHPTSELLVIELRREGFPTYAYATRCVDWKSEAAIHCMKHGPRVAHMFHWGKRKSLDEVRWHLIEHDEVRIDYF